MTHARIFLVYVVYIRDEQNKQIGMSCALVLYLHEDGILVLLFETANKYSTAGGRLSRDEMRRSFHVERVRLFQKEDPAPIALVRK